MTLNGKDFIPAAEISGQIIGDIRQIITEGRKTAYSAINAVIVNTYWKIGQRII